MESQRSFLVIGLMFVSFLLWQQWQLDYGPKPVQTSNNPVELQNDAPAANMDANEDVPLNQQAEVAASPIASPQSNATISVITDTLEVVIDTKGGDIISAKLRKYPVTQGSEEPLTILSPQKSSLFVAQGGLIGPQGPDSSPNGRPTYQSAQTNYVLEGNELIVPLSFQSEFGLNVVKQFVFKRNQHDVLVQYKITNTTEQAASLQQYAQLKQTMNTPEGSMFMPTYRGAAYSTQEERYEKYDFDDISDTNLKETTKGGWVSMLQHYFVVAWVPPKDDTNNLYSRALNGGYASIGYTGESVIIQPLQTVTLESTFYVGPKDMETLSSLADYLDLTVDYGFLWWLALPLFKLLSFIQGIVVNWGLAIVVITVIVKGAMYPLTKAQYESMAKLRALQPKMQALKDRFGDDRQKMSQGMMELYKKEKVNPMGGCFPLLLQMPIFLALYWVLLESVELRHADFVFWISDLSVKDPYFVLPVLTGASMYLLQKLQPMTIQDPMQQKIMQWMPVFMSIFFLWFPAGLVLYWLISNVITLVQAKMIYSAMDKKGLKTH